MKQSNAQSGNCGTACSACTQRTWSGDCGTASIWCLTSWLTQWTGWMIMWVDGDEKGHNCKSQSIILKMWAESCSVRCKQLVKCKKTFIWHVSLCLWQDQLVFFNLVKAVDAWDWESDKNFKFKVLEEEHDEECDEWNAESTLKLKEVVVSAREQFKWQTAGGEVHGPGYPAPLRPDIYHPPGWGEGMQPHQEGVRGAALRLFFFTIFVNFWKQNLGHWRQNSWE